MCTNHHNFAEKEGKMCKKGENHMKRKSLIILVLLAVCGLLISCADLRNVPEGSQSLGVFEGSFDGQFDDGSVHIELFQAPQGSKFFECSFQGGDVQVTAFARGTMTANTLEGKFEGIFDGTLNGQLSTDGNQLSGSYKIESPEVTPDSGTWKAMKK